MKRSLFLLFFLPSFLMAQTVKIDWGPEHIKKGYFAFPMKTIGQVGDDFYVMHSKSKKKKEIWKCNMLDKSISEQEIELKYQDKPFEFDYILRTKSNVFGAKAKAIKQTGKFEIILSKFENGHFNKPEKKYEHDYEKTLKFFLISFSSDTDLDKSGMFALSSDRSKVVFSNSVSSHDSKKNDKVSITVFDDEMNVLWEKIQDIPFRDKDFFVKRVLVTDNGKEIFLIGRYHDRKEDRYYEYKIFKISENDVAEYGVVLEDESVAIDIIPFYNEAEQSMIIGGFYRLSNKTHVNGVFCGKFYLKDKTARDFEYFTLDKKQRDYKINRYNIRNYRKLENGNVQFFAEYKGVFSGGTNPQGNSGTPVTTFKDLVTATINPEGKLINQSKLFRNANYSGYLKEPHKSYVLYYSKDRTYLTYTSILSKAYKKKFNLKGMVNLNFVSVFMCFDENGKVITEKALFPPKEFRVLNSEVLFLHENQLKFLGAKATTKAKIGPGKDKIVFQIGSIKH